ncbi:MAG: radical SAM protein [Neisseriaceae bacterium]
MSKLTFSDHSRLFKGYTYVYPVLSRRSQGISLGINLNINNACNWRCVYCQVDGLIRGKPDIIELEKLEYELDSILDAIVNGDFLTNYAPKEFCRLNDISISGNGEPTLSKQFKDVVDIIAKLRKKYNFTQNIKSVLITNGSEIERDDIQDALKILNKNNGEVWFKIDRGSSKEIETINQVHITLDSIKKRLTICCGLCKTFIQTCLFKINNLDPTQDETRDYIDFIIQFKHKIAGVFLYSTARNPMLPEGKNISQVSLDFLTNIANQLTAHGIDVKYYI